MSSSINVIIRKFGTSHPGIEQSIGISSFQLVSRVWLFVVRHGLHYARLPYPSSTPRAYSISCPSHRWCHPTISSSVVPFSSHLQSFPASGSFQMSQLFASGGQNIGVSASYIQSTSCEMPGWMKHKLESRLLREISRTSDMPMTPPYWQKVKN